MSESLLFKCQTQECNADLPVQLAAAGMGGLIGGEAKARREWRYQEEGLVGRFPSLGMLSRAQTLDLLKDSEKID